MDHTTNQFWIQTENENISSEKYNYNFTIVNFDAMRAEFDVQIFELIRHKDLKIS